jgi:hypothetical protein
VFAKVVYIKEGELIPIDNQTSLEKIVWCAGRQREGFVTNCLRALRQVSPGGSIRDIAFVVLVGGSSLDFRNPADDHRCAGALWRCRRAGQYSRNGRAA